jgi:uncharacterized repeat protein (TIGR01451 family)
MKSPRIHVCALAAALWLLAGDAAAVGTPAGTSISNVATVTADLGGTPISVDSNTDLLVTDELLELDVTLLTVGNVVTPTPATGRVLTYRVTNTGNGVETVTLTALSALGGDDFDPTLEDIYLDTNTNGIYDSGVDTLYAAGTNDPVLDANDPAADDVVVFVLNAIPGGLADGELGNSQLSAAANTGTGAPGDVFPNGGDGGAIDAIVGTTGADDSAQGVYEVTDVTLAIVKSSAVADLFGGSSATPGATITYTLVVTVTGSGSADDVVVSDAIPANTTYVAGSMTLNTVAQTDLDDPPTDDADFNVTTAGAITIALGTLPGGGPAQTVTFAVTID